MKYTARQVRLTDDLTAIVDAECDIERCAAGIAEINHSTVRTMWPQYGAHSIIIVATHPVAPTAWPLSLIAVAFPTESPENGGNS